MRSAPAAGHPRGGSHSPGSECPPARAVARWPAARAVVGATAVAVLAGCSLIAPSPPPVVIAADLALTGAGAPAGEVFRQALELRVEQVNRRRPAPQRRVELRVSDNRTDPGVAADNLGRIAADPAVTATITGGCPACAVATAPEVDAVEVPTVALAPGDAVASPPTERRFVFQLAPTAVDTAGLLAADLAAAGVRRVGLISMDDGAGHAAEGARELATAAATAGLELVVHERLPVPATGADPAEAAAVARVAGWAPAPGAPPADPAGPEAVVLWAPPAPAAALAVALREAGWSGRLALAAVAAGDRFLAGPAREALAGARLVSTETLVIDEVIAASPAQSARQVWLRDYVARYGGYDARAAFAADAVDVVVAAVARSGSTAPGPVRDTIAATRTDGLAGPLRFTPENHSGLQPLALTVLVASGDRWQLAR